MKLRLYTSDVEQPVPITYRSRISGNLVTEPGLTRRGIEIEVDSITAAELAALGSGWILHEGEWPQDVAPSVIDQETDAAIASFTHPLSPIGEQFGILREAIVVLYNALGMKATAGLAKLNEVAIAEIQKGREAKGLAPDGEKTTKLDPSSGLLSKLVAIAAKKGEVARVRAESAGDGTAR